MIFDSLRDNSKILIYIVVIAFAAGGLLVGVSGLFTNSKTQRQPASYNQVTERNIAVVNGKGISYQEYLQVLQGMSQQYLGQIGSTQLLALKSKVLDEMINQELLLQKAKEKDFNVEVSNEEVQTQIDKLINNYANSKADFEKILESRGLTLADVKADLKERIKQQKMLQKLATELKSGIKVTDQEIKTAYKKQTNKEELDDNFAKQKSEIKKQLMQQKTNQALTKLIEDYKAKAEIKINSPELRGFKAAQNKKFDKAIKNYKEALKQSGGRIYLYMNLADVYQKQGNNDLALETYQKALDKAPENAELRFALGNFYYQTGAKKKAVKQFDKASKLAGDDLLMHYRLLSIYQKMGYKEKSQAELSKIEAIQKKAAKERQKAIQKEAKTKTGGKKKAENNSQQKDN
ncbi:MULTISPECIES: SurA N-terminal domain-containing protein [unclassified Candidatus Frackibacter]|uniref:SurA N-terminal domain-containing protein n=1 Tax=unclassified Candidatus Frackibacter TaxID=2648818 RepID=UPI00088553D9|nr:MULTISPECIES: SurA N-terminal domain-containing protein [unclassified Candidatus Frackibacter]SDC64585.1 Tetratricopeptide repeat-containing protein [Candidatus Frackibacter sp. WG11]SEM77369.1 Tetratricopeptide repeat-containing protein [Candidatus Frackibacter sp. WG12]SFL88696.1 Tetratricopeptide repeat-containing protein [Candidatus Frackibacter sp. WG13]